MAAAKKYRDFVDSIVKSITTKGFIQVHTDPLEKLTNIMTALETVLKDERHARGDHRDLMAYLRTKLEMVKALEAICAGSLNS